MNSAQRHILWGAPPPRPPCTSRHPASINNERKAPFQENHKTARKRQPCRGTLRAEHNALKHVVFSRRTKTGTATPAPAGLASFSHITCHMSTFQGPYICSVKMSFPPHRVAKPPGKPFSRFVDVCFGEVP